MSENGEIYTAGKNFTLPPALTALTNSNSATSTATSALMSMSMDIMSMSMSPYSSELISQLLHVSSNCSVHRIML